MAYVAVVSSRFSDSCAFYEAVGATRTGGWDRPTSRAAVFDLRGLKVEILDGARERGLALNDPGDRVHLVVEVDDVDDARRGMTLDAPEPRDTSWGARLLELRDPDGVPVTFMGPPAGADGPPGRQIQRSV